MLGFLSAFVVSGKRADRKTAATDTRAEKIRKSHLRGRDGGQEGKTAIKWRMRTAGKEGIMNSSRAILSACFALDGQSSDIYCI